MAGFALFYRVQFDIRFPDTIGCMYPKLICIKFDNHRIKTYGKITQIFEFPYIIICFVISEVTGSLTKTETLIGSFLLLTLLNSPVRL